jgi:prepilin-type N-terminal cleavage/methylation domain-containing protein
MAAADTTPQPRSRRVQRGITMIELLAAMAVAGILTAMMLGSWFALSDSYSFTVRSDKARDKARLAISRLEREIRDAENRSDVAEVSVVRARPWFIVIYTTFNKDGNENLGTKPRLVMYRLYSDGELWRYHDADGDNVLEGGLNYTSETWPAASSSESERANGEGGRLLVDDVVNITVPSASNPTPLFQYAYFNPDGSVALDNMVTGTNNRFKIKSVEINLLVDTNPEHSPVYTNLQTTAQLRNQR